MMNSQLALFKKKSLLAVFLAMFSVALMSSATHAFQDDSKAEQANTESKTDTDSAPEKKPEKEDEPAEESEAIDFMDLSWDLGWTINTLVMFICAVLVFFMQSGFAMLEVGLNSSKNTVNILFKNIMDLSIGVLLFWLVGYGIMYYSEEGANGYFNIPSGIGISRDAQFDDDSGSFTVAPADDDGAPYASNAVDFLFQVAFAATAATIVSGAVAGRMKFGAYLIYSAVLTGIIYPISGFWKWGGGWLDQAGFQDFAGSVVVHAVGGFAGLAGAIVLGARIGRFSDGKSNPMPGHNIAFAALGVFILWVGWYGFNPGSQLTYNGIVNAEATSYIALTTTLAAAAGAFVAMLVGWGMFGKPDVTMALNGTLAGLVGITANCDQVTQLSAIIIGAVAGVLVVVGIIALEKLKIDDPVGAFPVHGICGVWGCVATGILGVNLPNVERVVDGETVEVALTRGEYIWVQCYSTLVICAWAFVTMLVLFLILKAVGILRVSAEEEKSGLDITEHGMHAYDSK